MHALLGFHCTLDCREYLASNVQGHQQAWEAHFRDVHSRPPSMAQANQSNAGGMSVPVGSALLPGTQQQSPTDVCQNPPSGQCLHIYATILWRSGTQSHRPDLIDLMYVVQQRQAEPSCRACLQIIHSRVWRTPCQGWILLQSLNHQMQP